MSNLQHGNAPSADRLPFLTQTRSENSSPRRDFGEEAVPARTEHQTMIVARPLRPPEWDMIRAFIRKTERDDLRLRFGQWLDFETETTLRRFFDIDGKTGELLCALDENGDVSGILHRVLISPTEAEIALIVRSDLKRTGIGEKLVRSALVRAAEQNLTTLRASVLGENRPMLRLARKLGVVPRKSAGFSVEFEFDLGRIFSGPPTRHLAAAAVTPRSPASAFC
jgi:acetyltransferase